MYRTREVAKRASRSRGSVSVIAGRLRDTTEPLPRRCRPRARVKPWRGCVRCRRSDVAVGGAGNRFLRLHHFDVAGHACTEAIAALQKLLIGQIDIRARRLEGLLRRLHIEHGRTDLEIHACLQIRNFSAPFREEDRCRSSRAAPADGLSRRPGPTPTRRCHR